MGGQQVLAFALVEGQRFFHQQVDAAFQDQAAGPFVIGVVGRDQHGLGEAGLQQGFGVGKARRFGCLEGGGDGGIAVAYGDQFDAWIVADVDQMVARDMAESDHSQLQLFHGWTPESCFRFSAFEKSLNSDKSSRKTGRRDWG